MLNTKIKTIKVDMAYMPFNMIECHILDLVCSKMWSEDKEFLQYFELNDIVNKTIDNLDIAYHYLMYRMIDNLYIPCEVYGKYGIIDIARYYCYEKISTYLREQNVIEGKNKNKENNENEN